ncbi:MAG: DUF2716 domain-containing protein [Ruminococcus sp.]|nr:DUF2716 domain-containing protein [Ruminococcus sp.]
MLLNKKQYNYIWNKIDIELKFYPNCNYRGHSFNVKLPFEINRPYVVYDIENMTDEQLSIMDDIIRECFIEITDKNDRIYAIDWQHAGFIYNPRNLNEQKGENGRFFPCFYPDGDYYFFISKDFRFGYLGHPWRQEVWIFGTDLINNISGKAHLLGWNELKRE